MNKSKGKPILVERLDVVEAVRFSLETSDIQFAA
jgi:hypothetical protein